MYKLYLTSRAKRQIKLISLTHQEAIVEALEEIAENPLIGKPLTRELTGKFSYRIGVYRIIYIVNKKDETVFILTAAHRATVYQ